MTRLALVLPRNMRFSPLTATAVDLCAHDYARASGLEVVVFARPVAAAFDDVALRPVERRVLRLLRRRSDFAAAIAALAPDAILVEQYAPEAAALARAFPRTPVLLRRHGLQKPPSAPWKRLAVRRRLGRLAGIVAVSEAVRGSLAGLCGAQALTVVPNGLDTAAWRPAATRAKTIAFAGRLAPEKGVAEAVEAVAATLAGRPEWSARFLFAEPGVHPALRERVVARAAAAGGGRITLAFDRPHAEVQALFEHAAIVLVPSVWPEPFGRTAIEAMAGGAALLTSATGGLGEIVASRGGAPVAEVVDPGDHAAFATALARLCDDRAGRERLAAAGRHHVAAHYDIHRTAAMIDRIVVDAAASAV